MTAKGHRYIGSLPLPPPYLTIFTRLKDFFLIEGNKKKITWVLFQGLESKSRSWFLYEHVKDGLIC